jgi:hypothetical protein
MKVKRVGGSAQFEKVDGLGELLDIEVLQVPCIVEAKVRRPESDKLSLGTQEI